MKGLRKYTAAVAQLFDAAESKAELISMRALDDRSLELRWRLEGVLQLPGRPRIKPYTGTTRSAAAYVDIITVCIFLPLLSVHSFKP